MKKKVIVVGAGAGGATVANELVKKGADVTVIESGSKTYQVGSFLNGLKFYDLNKYTKTTIVSKNDPVIIWRTLMPGGSTVVSCANMIESHSNELDALGISLKKEFEEIRNEISFSNVTIDSQPEVIKALYNASVKNNTPLLPINKCINMEKCKRCGECVLGCKFGAKWSANKTLQNAVKNGAKVIYNANAFQIQIEKNNKKTIKTIVNGKNEYLTGDIIILAAGALGSVRILKQSNFERIQDQLYLDMLINLYGIDRKRKVEPYITMPIVYHEKLFDGGFLVSPYVNRSKMVRLMECGVKGFITPTEHLVGLMIKVSDDGIGKVLKDGTIVKTITKNDRNRIEKGKEIALKLFEHIGIYPEHTFATRIQGAHPMGTLPIGASVNVDLQTHVDGVYVCDASVLPKATGLPPIMTIIALAKRLSMQLLNN